MSTLVAVPETERVRSSEVPPYTETVCPVRAEPPSDPLVQATRPVRSAVMAPVTPVGAPGRVRRTIAAEVTVLLDPMALRACTENTEESPTASDDAVVYELTVAASVTVVGVPPFTAMLSV